MPENAVEQDRKRRRTSKNFVTLQIATRALEAELLLPGGNKARKNSLTQNLLEMAANEGEQIIKDFEALIAIAAHHYQEEKTPRKLQPLVNAHYYYAHHLSVLRFYYFSCLEQAPTRKEKRDYAQIAMDKSKQLLQQIESIIALYDSKTDEYTEAVEELSEYTKLHGILADHLAKLTPNKQRLSYHGSKAKMWKDAAAPVSIVTADHVNTCNL